MIILLGLNALVYLKTIVECMVFKLHLIESSGDMYSESLGSIVPSLLLKIVFLNNLPGFGFLKSVCSG